MRRFFRESWRRRQAGEPLEGVARLVAEVVAAHPEYHALLADPEAEGRDWTPEQGETNPFLHMGLHVGLAEQLQTDRPAGIVALYQRLVRACDDPHQADHRLMECLGQVLWEAQRNQTLPDEAGYLECIRRLLAGAR